LITKIVPDKAQNDANANALTRFTTHCLYRSGGSISINSNINKRRQDYFFAISWL